MTAGAADSKILNRPVTFKSVSNGISKLRRSLLILLAEKCHSFSQTTFFSVNLTECDAQSGKLCKDIFILMLE